MFFQALLASSAFGLLPNMNSQFSGYCAARTDCIADCKEDENETVMSCMLRVCPKSLCSARYARSYADARRGAGSVRCDLETTCADCKKDRSHGHCAWVKADNKCMTTGEAMMSGKTFAELAMSASSCPARGLQELIPPTMRDASGDYMACMLTCFAKNNNDPNVFGVCSTECPTARSVDENTRQFARLFSERAASVDYKTCMLACFADNNNNANVFGVCQEECPTARSVERSIRGERRTSNWCASRCSSATDSPYGCDCSECAAGGRQNLAGRC